MKEKHTIGLTGGVGSGKSRILDILKQEYNAKVVETDVVAREMEEPGHPGFNALVDAFGRELIGGDGRLKKDVLVSMVFGDEKAREKINSLIHPLVWEYVKEQAGQGDFSVFVAESALLLENPDDFFDEIWYVYTLKEERIRRLMESRGYSRERCCRMIAGQPSEEEYLRCTDFVIDNNGSIDDVRQQIDRRLRV